MKHIKDFGKLLLATLLVLLVLLVVSNITGYITDTYFPQIHALEEGQ